MVMILPDYPIGFAKWATIMVGSLSPQSVTVTVCLGCQAFMQYCSYLSLSMTCAIVYAKLQVPAS